MFILWLTVCALAGMTACSDNGGDDGPAGDASLVGLWEVTAEYDGETATWDEEFGEQYAYTVTMEFCADGTGSERETDGGAVEENDFTYMHDGATLVVESADGEAATFGIDRLTGTELILSESYRQQGTSYTDLLVLRRIR